MRRWGLALVLLCVPALPAASATSDVALLAFETPDGIHLIDSDGTDRRKLPGTRPGDQNPRWSPDGRRLVFWRPGDFGSEVWIANADGSGRRALTDGLYNESEYPAWSPDGKLIAFERYDYDAEEWHVFVMRPDGGGARRVTPLGRSAYSPEWSPDGSRLVVTLDAGGVASVTLRGFHMHRIRTVGQPWAPKWSGDGAIAFNTDVHGKTEIYVNRGGELERITRNAVHDFDPVWSPDSQRIAFTTSRTGLWEVYVMDANGGNEQRVTREPRKYACCADWRPGP